MHIWLYADDDDDEDETNDAAMIMPNKKARMPPSKTDVVDNNKCSLSTLISWFAHPDTHEQKVAVLTLLTSGAKHVSFEVPNEEASAHVLKVLYELP